MYKTPKRLSLFCLFCFIHESPESKLNRQLLTGYLNFSLVHFDTSAITAKKKKQHQRM